jgi:hypothetical protein
VIEPEKAPAVQARGAQMDEWQHWLIRQSLDMSLSDLKPLE